MAASRPRLYVVRTESLTVVARRRPWLVGGRTVRRRHWRSLVERISVRGWSPSGKWSASEAGIVLVVPTLVFLIVLALLGDVLVAISGACAVFFLMAYLNPTVRRPTAGFRLLARSRMLARSRVLARSRLLAPSRVLAQSWLAQSRSARARLAQSHLAQSRLLQSRLVGSRLVDSRLVQPGLVQPGLAQSGLAQPGLAQPGLAQSGLAQPGLAQSGLVQPGLVQSGLASSGLGQSGLSARSGLSAQSQLAQSRELARSGVLDQSLVLTQIATRGAFDQAMESADRISETWAELGTLIGPAEAEAMLTEALWELGKVLVKTQELRAVLGELSRPEFTQLSASDATAQEVNEHRRATRATLAALDQEIAQRVAGLWRAERASQSFVREKAMRQAIHAAEESMRRIREESAGIFSPSTRPDAGSTLAEHTQSVLEAYRELSVRFRIDPNPLG